MNTNLLIMPTLDASIERHTVHATHGFVRSGDREDAYPRFRPEPLPDDYIESILRLAGKVPLASNRLPWQFIVVRGEAAKSALTLHSQHPNRRLNAPILVVAFNLKQTSKNGRNGFHQEDLSPLPSLSGRSAGQIREGAGSNGNVATSYRSSAPVHLALRTMILVAEAFGVAAVALPMSHSLDLQNLVGLPAEAENIAILALGFAEVPASELPSFQDFIHLEGFGRPWSA